MNSRNYTDFFRIIPLYFYLLQRSNLFSVRFPTFSAFLIKKLGLL